MIIIAGLVYTYKKRAFLSQTLTITNFIIFFLMFIIDITGGDVGVVYRDLGDKPIYLLTGEKLYTLITHMYIHGNILHILMNMIVLVLVGVPFEERVGTRNFCIIYFISGILGSFFNSAVVLFIPAFNLNPYTIGIGASGAIFGILGAFAVLYPRDEIPMFLFIIFLPRVPVMLVAVAFGAIETFFAFTFPQDGVGHLVHVGSLASGIFLAPLLVRTRKEEEEKVDLSVLEKLAVTKELKELFLKIKSEDEKDVKNAWIEHFLSKTNCPKCGERLRVIKGKAECGCGYELRWK